MSVLWFGGTEMKTLAMWLNKHSKISAFANHALCKFAKGGCHFALRIATRLYAEGWR